MCVEAGLFQLWSQIACDIFFCNIISDARHTNQDTKCVLRGQENWHSTKKGFYVYICCANALLHFLELSVL